MRIHKLPFICTILQTFLVLTEQQESELITKAECKFIISGLFDEGSEDNKVTTETIVEYVNIQFDDANYDSFSKLPFRAQVGT